MSTIIRHCLNFSKIIRHSPVLTHVRYYKVTNCLKSQANEQQKSQVASPNQSTDVSTSFTRKQKGTKPNSTYFIKSDSNRHNTYRT